MSNKYVPPFMKDSTSSQDKSNDSFWNSTPSSDQQRFHFSTKSNSYQPLVNTSKPAKEARKLEAGTLASLTKHAHHSQVPLSNSSKPTNLQSDQEFPSLGGSTKVSQQTLNNTYASLARRWGEQKKEDEEREKKEAKDAAEKLRLEKEKEEKERRLFKVRSHTFQSLNRKNNEDDDKYDIGCNNNVTLDDDDSYNSSLSDNDVVDDDDDDLQNEAEMDDAWSRRRNKNDLY